MLYENNRRRSVCACAQFDQCVCCSLFGYDNTCCSHSFKTLANLCSRACWFESYLDTNPEHRFSLDEVQMTCARSQESVCCVLCLAKNQTFYVTGRCSETDGCTTVYRFSCTQAQTCLPKIYNLI